MLRYSKEIAPDILKSFECGVPTMDEYIHYSAIPFYEKQGFFALQEYSDEYDTLRMALRV